MVWNERFANPPSYAGSHRQVEHGDARVPVQLGVQRTRQLISRLASANPRLEPVRAVRF